MNLRNWIYVSVALNVSIVAALVWHDSPQVKSEAPGTGTIPRNQRFVAPQSVNFGPATNMRQASFDWSEVETSDYKIYVANLRGIGCPEQTVRDIVLADINDLFSSRIRAYVDGVSGEFWNLMIAMPKMVNAAKACEAELDRLEDERDATLVDVFGGKDWLNEERSMHAADETLREWERIGDFLDEEGLRQWVAAKRELADGEAAIGQIPNLSNAERQERLRILNLSHWKKLRQIFTPDEYDELRLRQSSAADIANRIVGIEITESEVRALARAQFEFESASSAAGTLRERRIAVLGEERFAEVERAISPDYHELFRLAKRLDLPASTAVRVYETRQHAEQNAKQIAADESLSPEDRRLRLETFAGQIRAEVEAALGSEGFSAYEAHRGDWLKQLVPE